MPVEVKALQRQEREEQVTLTPGQPATETTLGGCIVRCEGNGVPLNVGVFAYRVGVGVVAGVLVHPPLVADTHHGVGEDTSHGVVRGARGKNLPMRSFVGNERHLGEDDTESGGDKELEPAVTEEKG